MGRSTGDTRSSVHDPEVNGSKSQSGVKLKIHSQTTYVGLEHKKTWGTGINQEFGIIWYYSKYWTDKVQFYEIPT